MFASYIDSDTAYTKTFKMYEIPRPREQQQKKLDGLQPATDFSEKRRFTGKDDFEEDTLFIEEITDKDKKTSK